MLHTFARTTALVAVTALGLGVAATAHAAGPIAQPFEFVGKQNECSDGWPAGARIAASDWVPGIGLPDNGSSNVPEDVENRNIPNRNDKRNGLLLAKTGSTPNCSSAGARIKSFDPIEVTADTTLGYDLRRGSHCSGGAPRFNVRTLEGNFAFVGPCGAAGSTSSPAPQDPTGWTRWRFNLSAAGIPIGDTVTSISIVFDEGTDSGDGLAVIDNIQVGDRLITNRGKSVSAD